ncbi:MAG: NAD-dependent epimerase/dehydratase family protein [Planctomycetes bacterium]|nr:NAD-dependent epimerase/dehydratase family protein [Planctomycetota bacterium]MCC7170852.1 NAD-dependent epimerase/dehydratase family protein [Planctomycetota bacterium]
MRVLVTGGAGFLGSHLVARLVARGDEVVVLDDLSTGDPDALDRTRVDLVVADVTDARRVDSCVAAVDRVVHLASVVGVERVAAEPERTEFVIERGAHAVIAAAARHAVPSIVVTSSEVYGFRAPAPVSETFEPVDVDAVAARWSYVRAKRVADRLARAAHAVGTPILTVRPFNIVGERQREDGGAVLPRFVARALRGEPLEVHGDGLQSRAFLDVRDAASALATLLERDRFACDAVNLGGRDEWTMLELAHEVVRVLAVDVPVVCVKPGAERGMAEIRRRLPDLTRLESLGIEPAPIDVAAVVARVAASLEATAAAR